MLFLLIRVTVPEINFPSISAAQIANNEWFKLAKETGVVYISFVIPFIIVAVYAALLRTVGQWLITILVLLFPVRSNPFQSRFVDEWTLEPLALCAEKTKIVAHRLRPRKFDYFEDRTQSISYSR